MWASARTYQTCGYILKSLALALTPLTARGSAEIPPRFTATNSRRFESCEPPLTLYLLLNKASATGTDIEIVVTYDIVFNRLERNLAQLGMNFRDEVEAFGIDPPGSTTGTRIRTVGGGKLDVPAVGNGEPLHREHKLIVSRASLDEDPGTFIPDDDEIRCRIRFLTGGFPPAASSEIFTNQVILFEDAGTLSPSQAKQQATG